MIVLLFFDVMDGINSCSNNVVAVDGSGDGVSNRDVKDTSW